MKSKGIHPTVSSVNAYIKKAGLKRYEFACALLDYLPESARYIQGSGEEHQCTPAWQKACYRWLAGHHIPRKDVLLAMHNYLQDQ